jgi:hypothetical protein
LRVAKFFIRATAGAAAAVGAGHATEPIHVAGKTFEDVVEHHEIQVVLMRAAAKLGNALECPPDGLAVANEDLSR